MSYFATLTFDLKDGAPEDYIEIRDELFKLHLKQKIKGNTGEVELPSNTYAGEFSEPDITTAELRDKLLKQIEKIFTELNLDAEIFLVIGDKWTWGRRKIS